MPYRMLCLSDAAEYLHVDQDYLKRLADEGELPYVRRGERLTFQRRHLDAWAARHILGLEEERLAGYHSRSGRAAECGSGNELFLAALIPSRGIVADMACRTRASAIRAMVELADFTGLVVDRGELLRTVLEREEICSTALPGGFAVLHPAYHDPYLADASFLVLGRSIQPIPFGAPDGRHTSLFFMTCCLDEGMHLHLLARLCLVCRDPETRESLLCADDARDMRRALEEAESRL